ncbi:MAG: DUF6414 family protein [Acidithiobacillus ferrivorans]
MFREFIYLDTDRIQSIISQLQEGLITEVLSGKTAEMTGKLGFISQLLPLGASAEYRRSSDVKNSKVLHDYAFNIAHESLKDSRLLIDVDDLPRHDFPVPETAFVSLQGEAKILDYESLIHLADNEKKIDKIFETSSPQPSSKGPKKQIAQGKAGNKRKGLQQLKDFVEIFVGHSIQVSITSPAGVNFMGYLDREHLREDIRNLIYKYGSSPQGNWVMLAQISRIPLETDLVQQMASLSQIFGDVDFNQAGGIAGVFALIIDKMNILQEVVSSVGFPNISVSPIAIYREVPTME